MLSTDGIPERFFFDKGYFNKSPPMQNYPVDNILPVLILVQTIYIGYQQTTLVGKELV